MSADANVFRWAIRRFFSKTELDAGALDARYFAESEFIATSAGAGDAGKPIKLDAGGHIDATMLNDADVDHGALGGLTDDDHTQYALLAGRSGGSTLYGGTAANDDLVLHGTSNATRTSSAIVLQPVGGKVGIRNGTPTFLLDIIQDDVGAQSLFSVAQAGVSNGFTITSNGSAFAYTMNDGALTVSGAVVASSFTAGGVAVVTTTGTQTLTNKTLTTPVISSIGNTGTLTLPTSTDTLVGRATTDTLTNKTLTTPTISSTGFTNAQHAHTGASSGGQLDHGAALTGLGDDDHTQYALLAGRSSGQTLNGGNAANEDLTIHGTAHATKTSSYVIIQPSGGQTIVGASSPLVTHPFEVQANNYAITLNPGYLSTTNYISSYTSGAEAPLAFFGSRVFVDGNQFGIGTSKTPTGTADSSGTTGDLGWDASYIYVKTGAGWKRAALSSF